MRVVVLLMLVGALILPWSAFAQDQTDPEATIRALQTEVARLEGEIPTATPSTAATPEAQPQEMASATESGESALPRTVNLEIILDDSGSMGQIIDTGETRLDAAKRVLNEVITAIPDEPGINVGLRIYGHQGDNTDAGRAVSCQASDLVVPVSGVDRTAIAQQIASLVPTGWTPIGLSLERSEADFPASEEVPSTNAVVLVTDGLETCNGDPAAAAAALVSSDTAVVTHVIGFALAPEEQQILESITAASGGMLLSAANATELTGALFTILDELDVVKGVGLLGGSALSLLPPGEPGGFSIVAMGTYDGNILPFVVRNNTGEPMVSLSATGHAWNAAGQLIATGDDHNLNPNLVRPGGLSLGYIYFGGVDLPPETTFQIEVEGTPAAEEAFELQRDLEVVEAAFVDGRVVGTLRNGYDELLNGPFRVQLGCFDQDGALIALERDYSPEDDAEPGETVTFQSPGFRTLDCPLFLVAGSGLAPSFDRQHKASDILTPESDQRQAPQPTSVDPTSAPNLEAVTDDVAGAPVVMTPATPGPDNCYRLDTALDVVSALSATGLPIGEYIDYTPETDLNELMGRPGGYISKTNFQDTRLDPESTDFAIQDGGAVEVFAAQEDLEDRITRLETNWELFPLLPKEVLFTSGTVLLRVSTRLLIPDSDAYGTALQEVAACG